MSDEGILCSKEFEGIPVHVRLEEYENDGVTQV